MAETPTIQPSDENPDLKVVVEKETPVKTWLIDYVGEKANPENGEVTVEMIVDVLAAEFPEFLMVLAEENWLRGYHQGVHDVELGRKMAEAELAAGATESEEDDNES
tara:strand:- start:352 stop:672 length:321 start_codon:yes stop_codon:yes gene_type:complete